MPSASNPSTSCSRTVSSPWARAGVRRSRRPGRAAPPRRRPSPATRRAPGRPPAAVRASSGRIRVAGRRARGEVEPRLTCVQWHGQAAEACKRAPRRFRRLLRPSARERPKRGRVLFTADQQPLGLRQPALADAQLAIVATVGDASRVPLRRFERADAGQEVLVPDPWSMRGSSHARGGRAVRLRARPARRRTARVTCGPPCPTPPGPSCPRRTRFRRSARSRARP